MSPGLKTYFYVVTFFTRVIRAPSPSASLRGRATAPPSRRAVCLRRAIAPPRSDIIKVARVVVVGVLVEVEIVIAKLLALEHLSARVDLHRVGQLSVSLQAARLVAIVFQDDVRPANGQQRGMGAT